MSDPKSDLQQADAERASSCMSETDAESEAERPGPSPRACYFSRPGQCDGHGILNNVTDCDFTSHLWMEHNNRNNIYVCRRHYNLFTRQKCNFPLHLSWWKEKGGTKRKDMKDLSLRHRDVKELHPCPVRLIPLMEGLPPGMVCKACLEMIDKDDVVSNLPNYLPPYPAIHNQDCGQDPAPAGSSDLELEVPPDNDIQDPLVSVELSGLV